MARANQKTLAATRRQPSESYGGGYGQNVGRSSGSRSPAPSQLASPFDESKRQLDAYDESDIRRMDPRNLPSAFEDMILQFAVQPNPPEADAGPSHRRQPAPDADDVVDVDMEEDEGSIAPFRYPGFGTQDASQIHSQDDASQFSFLKGFTGKFDLSPSKEIVPFDGKLRSETSQTQFTQLQLEARQRLAQEREMQEKEKRGNVVLVPSSQSPTPKDAPRPESLNLLSVQNLDSQSESMHPQEKAGLLALEEASPSYIRAIRERREQREREEAEALRLSGVPNSHTSRESSFNITDKQLLLELRLAEERRSSDHLKGKKRLGLRFSGDTESQSQDEENPPFKDIVLVKATASTNAGGSNSSASDKQPSQQPEVAPDAPSPESQPNLRLSQSSSIVPETQDAMRPRTTAGFAGRSGLELLDSDMRPRVSPPPSSSSPAVRPGRRNMILASSSVVESAPPSSQEQGFSPISPIFPRQMPVQPPAAGPSRAPIQPEHSPMVTPTRRRTDDSTTSGVSKSGDLKMASVRLKRSAEKDASARKKTYRLTRSHLPDVPGGEVGSESDEDDEDEDQTHDLPVKRSTKGSQTRLLTNKRIIHTRQTKAEIVVKDRRPTYKKGRYIGHSGKADSMELPEPTPSPPNDSIVEFDAVGQKSPLSIPFRSSVAASKRPLPPPLAMTADVRSARVVGSRVTNSRATVVKKRLKVISSDVESISSSSGQDNDKQKVDDEEEEEAMEDTPKAKGKGKQRQQETLKRKADAQPPRLKKMTEPLPAARNNDEDLSRIRSSNISAPSLPLEEPAMELDDDPFINDSDHAVARELSPQSPSSLKRKRGGSGLLNHSEENEPDEDADTPPRKKPRSSVKTTTPRRGRLVPVITRSKRKATQRVILSGSASGNNDGDHNSEQEKPPIMTSKTKPSAKGKGRENDAPAKNTRNTVKKTVTLVEPPRRERGSSETARTSSSTSKRKQPARAKALQKATDAASRPQRKPPAASTRSRSSGPITPRKPGAVSLKVPKVSTHLQPLLNCAFLVSLSPSTALSNKRDSAQRSALKERIQTAITELGGAVFEKWEDLVQSDGQILGDGGARWIFKEDEFKYTTEGRSERLQRALFCVVDEPNRMTKYWMALALGIPCVSIRWIEDLQRHQERPAAMRSDWTNYVVAAGWSESLQCTMSQMVERDWIRNGSSKSLKQIIEQPPPHVRKPFRGLSILFVCGRDRDKTLGKIDEEDFDSTYAPAVLACLMGPARVEIVHTLEQASLELRQPGFPDFSPSASSQETQTQTMPQSISIPDIGGISQSQMMTEPVEKHDGYHFVIWDKQLPGSKGAGVPDTILSKYGQRRQGKKKGGLVFRDVDWVKDCVLVGGLVEPNVQTDED